MNGQVKSYSNIVRAGVLVLTLSLIDKAAALGKEIAIAQRFGISHELDVFNVALALPGITVLMISGAFISAFVPMYLEWSYRSSRQDADAKSVGLFLLTSAGFTVLALFGYLASPRVFSVIGYGFGAEAKQLGASLESLLMFMLLFDGMGIVLTGILYARKWFVALYTAPLCVNIAIILMVLLNKEMGIYSLVWGTVIGTLGKTIWMLTVLRRDMLIPFKRWAISREDIRLLAIVALPLLGGQLVANSNILVDQVMAGGLSSGSVSALRYAYRINDLPIQVIVLALSRSIFPFISEMAVEKDYQRLRQVFSYSLILLAFITLPIMSMIVLFADDVVKLVLQRGAFDTQATHKTAQILICYSMGLFFHAYTFLNSAFFAALKDTMPLLKLGCMSLVLNVALNLLFMQIWDVKGIALSTTVGHALLSAIFVVMLKRRLDFKGLFRLKTNMLKLLSASVGMFLLGLGMDRVIDAFGINRLAGFISAVLVLCIAYLSIVWVLRTPEIEDCFTFVTKALGWHKHRSTTKITQ